MKGNSLVPIANTKISKNEDGFTSICQSDHGFKYSFNGPLLALSQLPDLIKLQFSYLTVQSKTCSPNKTLFESATQLQAAHPNAIL